MKISKQTSQFILFIVVAFSSQSAFSFSLLEWLGLKDKEPVKTEESTATQKTETNSPETDVEAKAEQGSSIIKLGDIKTELDIDELKLIFANLSEEKRKQVLSEPDRFSELVKQQLALKSVLKAAMANNLHQDPNTMFLVQKTAENAFREVYVKRLIAEKISADFPSDEQIQKFYEENKKQFVIEERVHVWQIFLPFENDSDIESIKALEKKAESVKKDIDSGKLSFAEAAAQFSSHLPSRNNGGYMGLVKVSDIIPAIRERVMKLKADKLSTPFKTESGIHIARRGAIVPAQPLELEQAEGQIRTALRQEAGKRFRQAVLEQSNKSYPIEINDKKIEEWRLKLRTNL